MNTIKHISLCIMAFILLMPSTTVLAVSDGEVEDFKTNIIFSDVSEASQSYSAILSVAEAGIMSGYEDGSFKPKDNISRDEFATIICRLLGVEQEAQKIKKSPFNDVDDNNWAVGRIAKAAELGIVNGYGDGNFGPSDYVLYEQAIKMLVCAKEKDDEAESLGGYPNGYILVAEKYNMLDNVSYSKSAVATRENIAKIISNILNNSDNAFVSAQDDELSTRIN